MNVLVTRHDKIGDFITVLPLLKILKYNTNNRVIVMVSKINYDLACSINYIDDVILYSDNLYKNISEIKNRKIDVSISCFIDNKLGVTLFLSHIKTRISPATKLAQFFFNKTIKQKRSKVEKTEWQYNIGLLKLLDPDINCLFDRPLLFVQPDKAEIKQKIIAFHPGFGGSSEGNLKLDDYLRLAKSIAKKENVKVIFTFGPDDADSKQYIENNIDFTAELIDSKRSLVDFCKLISSCAVFVSTSTGPMHLAGALNIKTLSFFGNTLFASSKRWATISDKEKQANFEVPKNYDETFYLKVEKQLNNIVSEHK
ncbi:glycosyltransferase family 9 protein [methanotrophic endosymbiont of Bathymodiolus puteoserpentis (Logatchev)]|jgi:ADP-heptose:LPS heptosyltransferase|uniref:glycosyltransferase family 9 protein n=1 Tax=methanotrophic endosymbiont of Bathymodiolus puteoserpentis (Logatchev) TaxID=343235 RepID=UPI00086F2D0A|nr:glycosyltransferase family 9 protein [methanotrophic endosymbiont of Bathymodiolus puteoserpentis (Logatchev)]SCN47286.1 ADP-heptose--lipooligosaccharide heptosyltransferase II [methanotrophic endosymbiont of Bathymodiolus azoricus (Menez Gwen)]SHE20216.1 ADP-heptose--lipooligosaccharide heptosyltransferase II [methanotrophic endosymbiont of Bathymodiolus puteoserpentis (Logatchev)]